MFAFIDQKDHERARKNMEKTLKQGSAHGLEYTFLTKDGDEFPAELSARVIKDSADNPIGFVAITQDITERKRAKEELQESYQRTQQALRTTIEVLEKTTEERDPYTAGHQKRVTQLAGAIAREMKLPKDKIEGIFLAGSIHDIGKMDVPAKILSKPSKLKDAEMELIKDHPQVGYDILKEVDFPWPVAEIVLQHHERMDGSGYPKGLSGNNIWLEARILAVADVVEAMASHRPYRPAKGIDKALEEIKQNKGMLYDPQVVEACVNVFNEGFKFEEIE